MSSVTRPRGPLPRRVYWTRRLLVVGLAVALVFTLGRMLGAEPEEPMSPSARPAVGTPAASIAGPTPSVGANEEEPLSKQGGPRSTNSPLAVPTGPCSDQDVLVTPAVDGKPYAGSDVAITLNLRTLGAAACTWEVSSSSVVVKLTSGSDRIWSTQDCPSSVQSKSVIVRRDEVTKVDVVWSGQRSDDDCSRTTQWAQPGYYHAEAAALGAEPADHQFRLLPPVRPTITQTAKPKPTKQPS